MATTILSTSSDYGHYHFDFPDLFHSIFCTVIQANSHFDKMNFTTLEYKVPSHWMSAIVNGDETSFDYYDDPQDYQSYKDFCEHEVRNAIVEVTSEESYFSWSNDAEPYGVKSGCDVVDCLFHYPES